MNQSEEREREIAELRDRLSRLTEASLRINESLDFDTVLQGVLDSARSLTEARSGVITLLDDSGRIADFLSSGMTAEEAGLLWDMPDGMRLFEYLGSAREPLRLRLDLLGHVRSLGLPEFRPPAYIPTGGRDPACPLPAGIRGRSFTGGELAGRPSLYVAEKPSRIPAGVPFACGVRRLKVPMTIGGDTPKANGTPDSSTPKTPTEVEARPQPTWQALARRVGVKPLTTPPA